MRLVCCRDVFPPMLPEGLAGGIGGMRTEAPLVVTMTMEMHGGVVALGHSFIEDGLIGHEEVLDTRKLWTRVIDYATVACSPCLQHANMRLVCYRDVFPPTPYAARARSRRWHWWNAYRGTFGSYNDHGDAWWGCCLGP